MQQQTPRRSPLEMNRNLLRGVPADLVLRRCARLLSSAASSYATYDCSARTDHLSAFISHNWSVHFNFLSALLCGILTAAVLCVASSWRCLPLPATHNNYKHQGIFTVVSAVPRSSS